MASNLPLLRYCNTIKTKAGNAVKVSLCDGDGDATIYRNVVFMLGESKKYTATVDGDTVTLTLKLTAFKDTVKPKQTAPQTTDNINDDCPF